jgi:DNA repair ATPase RecN
MKTTDEEIEEIAEDIQERSLKDAKDTVQRWRDSYRSMYQESPSADASEALLFAIAKVNALSDIIGVLGGLVEDLETRISAVEGCIARLVSMVDPEGFKEINNALDMSEEDVNMAIRILNKNNVGEA